MEIPQPKPQAWLDRPLSRWAPPTLESLLVALILLLAVASRFYDLGARSMSHDEVNAVVGAYSLYQGQGYHYDPITHGPLLYHLMALSYFLFGDSDFTSRIPAAAFSVAAIAFVLGAYRRYLGRVGALVAGFLLLISPSVLFYGRYARNEAFTVLWGVATLYAMLRYLERGETGMLFLFTLVNALHFTDKATAYIYAAEELLFLAGYLLWRLSRRGRLPLRRVWKLLREERAFDLGILLGTLILPLLAALPLELAGFDPLGASSAGGLRAAAALLPLALLAALIGLWWRPRLWLKCAAIFYVLFIFFYTTIFSNPSGLAGGLLGALGYWTAQQAVNRGEQPLYYYLLLQIPLYEFLPAVGALLAAWAGLRRRLWVASPGQPFQRFMEPEGASAEEQEVPVEDATPPAARLQAAPTLALLLFWSLGNLLAFSFAGEKMPWLTVNIALPLILATGWGLGCLLESWSRARQSSTWRRAARMAVLAGFALLALQTMRTAYRAAFINYDNAMEYLVYAHASGDVKYVLSQIEDISRRTTDGLNLVVAYDNNTRYPYWWYLRHFPNRIDYDVNPTRDLRRAAVILVGEENTAKMAPIVGNDYLEFDYTRLWWPNQDYWSLKWSTIAAERAAAGATDSMSLPEYLAGAWQHLRPFFSDPQVRSAIWQIWLNRDYSQYAALKNTPTLTLEGWQPSDRMRMYLRKDVAAQVWGTGAGAAASGAASDPYAAVTVQLAPDQAVGAPGSAPGQLQSAHGLAVAPDGSLYVADTLNNRIQHFSPGGEILGAWGTFADASAGAAPGGTFNQPWGVAVAPDGSVYVADTWNHRVQKFGADGKFVTMWGSLGQGESPEALYGPRGIAVDAQGRVYVADTGNKRILVFDGSGKALAQFGGAGAGAGQLDEPVGVAVGVDGKVYVADTWNQRVQVFAPGAGGNFTPAAQWPLAGWSGQSLDNKPYLAVDRQGHVLLTDPEGYRALEFDPKGQILRAWGDFPGSADGLTLPSGHRRGWGRRGVAEQFRGRAAVAFQAAVSGLREFRSIFE